MFDRVLRAAGMLLGAVLLAACSGGGAEAVTFPPPPTGLVRGPQIALVGPTEAVVAFVTEEPTTAEVEYGRTLAYGSSVVDASMTADHALRLDGLLPGTRYEYRIMVGGAVLTEGHFLRTVPSNPAAPYRFAALGDSGSASQAQVDVAEVLAAEAPDLVIHTGDVVYETGAPAELDPHYFLPYRSLVDRIPFYISLGNHDTYHDDAETLLAALHLPINSATGSERFYSFDRGGSHFIALDSNIDLLPGSVQNDWLASDLGASAGATWTFVFFHHALYSSGGQGNDPDLRASLAPLFEQWGVDVVFNGHDHLYHRSFPVAGNVAVDTAQEPDYVAPGGPVYIVTGGGGKSIRTPSPRSFTAYTEGAYHAVFVDVDGTRLTLRAVRSDGTEMDRMTLTTAAP